MTEQYNSDDIRQIAREMTDQQGEVCDAKRANLIYRYESLASIVQANATAISALTSSIVELTTAIGPLAARMQISSNDMAELRKEITELKTRPAVAAAIAAAVPVLLGVLLWWFSR